MTAKPTARASLGTVFGIVFLDIVGFSILFPLFPALLEHYVGLEGTDSVIGRLRDTLVELAGDDEHAVVTFFGGILGALYSLLQFLFAPFWGGLSDRIGRRPTLLVTLVGTVLAYALWMFAGSFALLSLSRLLGGIMAGNISPATAVAADTTTSEKRASGMAIVGMAIGLGFILGPAIGGLTVSWQPGAPADGAWSSGFAWNPFSGPAVIATALGLLNLVLVVTRLPESLPAEKRGARKSERGWNPIGAARRLGIEGVARTTLVSFLYTIAFSAMEFTLTFLAVERLAFEPRDNAWMFVFIGFVIAFVQGGIVRRMAPRVGEQRMLVAGLALILPGLGLIAVTSGVPLLYAGLFFLATGSALAMPCMSALVSRYTPDDRQGAALGAFRSAGSLARAIGPFLGGVLYWRLGSAAPYLVGAVLLLAPLFLALRLPPTPTRGSESEDPNPA